MSDDNSDTQNPWQEPDRARRVRQVMEELRVDEQSARQIVARAEGRFDSDVLPGGS